MKKIVYESRLYVVYRGGRGMRAKLKLPPRCGAGAQLAIHLSVSAVFNLIAFPHRGYS